jgi:hypothetical protein
MGRFALFFRDRRSLCPSVYLPHSTSFCLYALSVRHSACMHCLYVALPIRIVCTSLCLLPQENTCACVLTPRLQCAYMSSLSGMLAYLTACNTIKSPLPGILAGAFYVKCMWVLFIWNTSRSSLSGILDDPFSWKSF